MDLETLNDLKTYADFMSDGSSKTFLYSRICEEIKKANKSVNCPFCDENMKGFKLTHFKCKKCNEYFTD